MISKDSYNNMCNSVKQCKVQNMGEKNYYYNNSIELVGPFDHWKQTSQYSDVKVSDMNTLVDS